MHFEHRLQAASLSQARLPSISAAAHRAQAPANLTFMGLCEKQQGTTVILIVPSHHFLYYLALVSMRFLLQSTAGDTSIKVTP